ncbi:N-acetylglucosamine kinase [Demetria terragena]|uniref:N-acetylglucosamine kinase n=1 Tax=Demetria terragena TaxID=63959 RepID=UPI0014613C45|nr:BadF/BadG/BcrA/BcrD ATPase family protein [Demetria terragena]
MTDVTIDLGKTNCRARTVGGSPREAEGDGAPGLAASNGTSRAAAAIFAILRRVDLAPDDQWDTVSIGAAGALAAPDSAAECAQLLLRESGARQVIITSDAITAHLGTFLGGPGVTLVAGTGTAAIAVNEAGALARGDGSGPETGDRGSGAWIGRVALQRANDGSTPLAQRAHQRYGADWRDLLDDARAYELSHRRAEFVADVKALARMGDLTAVSVIRQAAEELASTTLTAIDQLTWTTQPVAVALTGGLTGLGPVLTEPLTDAVKPAVLVAPRGDAHDGARLLIERTDLPHEALTYRAVAT